MSPPKAGLVHVKPSYDLVIVGCGLSGAVFAEQAAARYGLTSLIIDKREHIGAPSSTPLARGHEGEPPPSGCRTSLARRQAATASTLSTSTASVSASTACTCSTRRRVGREGGRDRGSCSVRTSRRAPWKGPDWAGQSKRVWDYVNKWSEWMPYEHRRV